MIKPYEILDDSRKGGEPWVGRILRYATCYGNINNELETAGNDQVTSCTKSFILFGSSSRLCYLGSSFWMLYSSVFILFKSSWQYRPWRRISFSLNCKQKLNEIKIEETSDPFAMESLERTWRNIGMDVLMHILIRANKSRHVQSKIHFMVVYTIRNRLSVLPYLFERWSGKIHDSTIQDRGFGYFLLWRIGYIQ